MKIDNTLSIAGLPSLAGAARRQAAPADSDTAAFAPDSPVVGGTDYRRAFRPPVVHFMLQTNRKSVQKK